ncbi:T9SS type B sorting domain-containing protein [Flavobacterium sp.]|uniref:T9SS type B sorting domain-containing protein n=1 Tax=Flavobacterium sp. TaxID=239 RepID=UPI0037BFBB58
MKKTFLQLFLFLLFIQNAGAQCFEIESIFIDACGGQEGLNEMVRFKVGPAPLNVGTLNVNWPNNPWQGLVQNATTATKVADLNADIVSLGGCAELLEPTSGILPANATVILVTSFNMDTTQNSFGALTEDIYILFQNNSTTTTGHFANFGVGNRTLTMNFGGCFDSVTYDRSQLINSFGINVAGDGATVLFTPSGNATYTNYGCFAPVPPFIVDILTSGMTICAGETISLSGTAEGYQTLTWSASTGSFTNVNSLATSFTIPSNASGTIIVTLTAINSCGLSITDTVSITITNPITPNFATSLTLCSGETAPTLNTTSPNGIVGTWSPSTINNTMSGNYVFNPNPNQCATPIILAVTITNSITPDYATSLTLCNSATAPTLNTTSPNGIVGTWSPSTINNTMSGNYLFTPNPNQCATPITLTVTITNSITPDFATTLTLCNGDTAPTLNTTSHNGIVGTWSPSTINNTISGNYVFTPNPNQCATPITLAVTITNSITPNFATTLTLCNGATAPMLNTTSPNGIVGTWSPSTINNTMSGNYVFTPNPNQCATPITLTVTITNSITPDFATSLTLCNGDTAPMLNTTSPNGIVGTWSPSTIDNNSSGNYLFTPNTNQCATPVTLAVTITNTITPDFVTTLTLCNGATAPTLNTTSPNGIVGTWSPSTINNTMSGNYVFSPNPNQCATPTTLAVTITNSITPDFATTLTLCNGATAPILNTTSPNGIVGTWSPPTINNTISGNYVFTPNPNQCATPITLAVTITNSITPDFATTLTLCNGDTAPTLNTTSPNGIVGTWSPSTINNTMNGNYVFTPNPNQCATPITLAVTITNSITPDFATSLTLCNGETAPTLNFASPNGIVGTWSPSTINNTSSGNYVFSPNPNQCATPITLAVTITNSITPNFATTLTLCNGDTAPTLNTTSPNGIVGTWSPSTINNTMSGNYVFTPNPNQCATPIMLAVTINAPTVTITGIDTLCVGQSTLWIPSITGGLWSSNNTTVATIDTNGNITALASGTTTLNYFIQGSCDTTISKTVTVVNPTSPGLSNLFVCLDNVTGDIISPVLLESGVSSTDYSFVWTLNGDLLPTTQNAHLATEIGIYTVTATHLLTGCSGSSTATITGSSIALATASVGIDFQLNQTITVSITGGSGKYVFSLNDGPFQTLPYFTHVLQGENSIVVKDLNGCDDLVLTVYALKYPPFFTPNGDGFNDTWNINGLEDQPASLIYIFDRYGKLLKTLKASGGNGWDGTYNGAQLPATDYWFTLMYTNREGLEKEFKAHFSLKR